MNKTEQIVIKDTKSIYPLTEQGKSDFARDSGWSIEKVDQFIENQKSKSYVPPKR